MPTSPFVVDKFPGLRLDVAPEDLGLGGAVDLLNVDFDRIGAIRTRSGSTKWSGTALSSTGYQAVFRSPTHGGELILIRGVASGPTVGIDRMPDGGTITNVGSISLDVRPISAAVLGTPTSTTIYFTVFSSLTTGQTIRKYDGTTLGTGTGKPTHVATWPTSNRLVQGGYFAAADSPSGSNGSRSTVFFSDPGAPDTYTANNFVTLRPGDGEAITSIVSWRDMLFVFKESSVFIFYGESTDADGNAVFNYRRVDLPAPILDVLRVPMYATIATPGPDGVYYSTPRGIFRTAGDTPQVFTASLAGLFNADSSVSTALHSNGYPPSLTWVNERLVASYTTAAALTRQLVFHAPTGQWTVWSLGGSLFSPSPEHLSGDALLLKDGFWFVNGNDVWSYTSAASSDGASAIAWSYTSGRYSLDPGKVTITNESSVLGSGTATLRLDSDLYSNQSASATLGTAPAVAEGWPSPVDQEGTWLQYTLSGTGPASVTRLTHLVQASKPSGVR